MKLPIHLGQTVCGESFTLPLEAMKRHFLALGGTGSGKTVLCKAVVEECIRYNLPCLAVDLQGDLLSLGLHSDHTPEGAVPVSDVTVAKYRERLDVKVWTPGSSLGIPLSFAPDMAVPNEVGVEDKVRAFGAAASGLGSMLGDKKESTVAGLHMILEYADNLRLCCSTLDDLALFLKDPPFDLAELMEPFMPAKARKKVLESLTVKRVGVNRLLFDLGQPVDVAELFGLRVPGPAQQGKARLSIIYLAHLSPDQQQIFLALLFSAMYRWMLTQNDNLSGLFYMDEIAPFCPPVKSPPAKDGLMLLLRQARKYGLCCLLATQSPGDVDYKALGQFGTLALGKIDQERALSKVGPVIRAYPGMDSDAIIDSLRRPSRGRFVVINSDHLEEPTPIQGRWLATEHRLVEQDDIGKMVSFEDREILG